MYYRDFMQKYRPLFAPPDVPGAAPSAEGDAGAAPAPAATAAAPAPVAETAPAAAAAAEPAAASAADAAATAAEIAKPEPTLLEAADGKKPDVAAKPQSEGAKESPAPAETAKTEGETKPDAKDAKTDGEKKPDAEVAKDAAKADPKDEGATQAAPAPIKYEAFKLPEGVTFDDERLGKFTEVAGKAQIPQDVAQSLVSLHVEEMARYANEVQKAAEQNQREVWRKLNDTWKADFRKDERLGGNRAETTLAMAKAVLEEYGGTPDQVRELIAHTSNNGMGNFPGFIRLLANIGEALNVFEASDAPANPNAPKLARTRGERWYPSMGNGNGATR